MLAAANRMRSAADFSETTRRGAKASRGSVVVYVNLSDRAEAEPRPPRVGMVVGKAVGNSVVRHRASRRIRGAFGPLMAGLPEGSRVVVRALAGADRDADLATHLAAGLEAALTKAGRR